MNIFFLDRCPQQSAYMQCDKHVPKMCAETVQMLVSALRRNQWTDDMLPLTKAGKPHKGGYAYHPATVWAGDSVHNFAWLLDHGFELCREFEFRFMKEHFAMSQIEHIYETLSLEHWGPDGVHHEMMMTDVPLCIGKEMQAEFGASHAPLRHAVEFYREFYKRDKAEFATWDKGRPTPNWWQEEPTFSPFLLSTLVEREERERDGKSKTIFATSGFRHEAN